MWLYFIIKQKVKFRNKEQYIKTHPHHLHPNQTHGMQTQIRKKNKWKRRRETFFSMLILTLNLVAEP
jgi:hypothetical protein